MNHKNNSRRNSLNMQHGHFSQPKNLKVPIKKMKQHHLNDFVKPTYRHPLHGKYLPSHYLRQLPVLLSFTYTNMIYNSILRNYYFYNEAFRRWELKEEIKKMILQNQTHNIFSKSDHLPQELQNYLKFSESHLNKINGELAPQMKSNLKEFDMFVGDSSIANLNDLLEESSEEEIQSNNEDEDELITEDELSKEEGNDEDSDKKSKDEDSSSSDDESSTLCLIS